MRRVVELRKLLLVLAVAAGMLVLTPGTSWACSCVTSTPAQQVERADTVVDGSLVWTASNGIETTYSVKVDQVFKGSAAGREKLITKANEASCGLGQLASDKRYLFFIRGEHPGQMRVDLCGGSTPYDAALASQVQAVTGAPKEPLPTPTNGPDRTSDDQVVGTSVWTILGTGAVLVVVIGGLLLLRRKTSRYS